MTRGACCANTPAYLIEYERMGTVTEMEVCGACYMMERRSEDAPDYMIRPFQRSILRITCRKCGMERREGSCGCRGSI